MPTHDPSNPEDSKLSRPDHIPDRAGESNDFMTLHQGSDPESKAAGYELTDANVKETAIFLVVLASSLAVVFVLAFGIGKLINMNLASQDGPTNKWSQLAGAKPANLESDPQMKQQQLDQMVKKFPTPRLETDDGNVDVAQMHAREDMLLNHYSWVDEQRQTVRIPIARAMQLLVQRGLPVEGQQEANKEANKQQSASGQSANGQSGDGQSANAQSANNLGNQQRQPAPDDQVMFGDGSEAVTAPLTDGFARTAPELRMMQARQQQMETGSPRNTQAELHPGH